MSGSKVIRVITVVIKYKNLLRVISIRLNIESIYKINIFRT